MCLPYCAGSARSDKLRVGDLEKVRTRIRESKKEREREEEGRRNVFIKRLTHVQQLAVRVSTRTGWDCRFSVHSSQLRRRKHLFDLNLWTSTCIHVNLWDSKDSEPYCSSFEWCQKFSTDHKCQGIFPFHFPRLFLVPLTWHFSAFLFLIIFIFIAWNSKRNKTCATFYALNYYFSLFLVGVVSFHSYNWNVSRNLFSE